MTDSKIDQRWLMRLSVVLFVAGLAVTGFVVVRPSFTPNVSDFARDLVGAEAVNNGLSPYQRLGEIADAIPHIDVPDDARGYWVAHTPLSIAGARLLLAIGGDDAEDLFYLAVVLSAVGLFFLVWASWGRRQDIGLALVGVIALGPGIPHDLIWLQGASIVALLLASVYRFADNGRHLWALILLSVVVAWKPWTAPLALFIPRSDSPISDTAKVGLGALALTGLSLPVLGGFGVLRDWVTEALPGNTATYLAGNWNLSLTSRWLGAVGCLVLVTSICLLLSFWRRRVGAETARVGAALCILTFSPLVWPWYWISLLPALVRDAPTERMWWIAAALLTMSFPVTGWNEPSVRVASAVAVVVVAVGLIRGQVGNDPRGGPRFAGEPRF